MAGKLDKKRMQRICDELAKGKSLRSICDSDTTQPHWVTVLQAVQRNDDLYEMYSKARAIGAEVLADEMHDLARQPLPTDMEAKHMNAEVQRRRLEVDTLKWTFARQQPRGVRNKSADVDQPSSITLVWAADDAGENQDKVTGEVVKLVQPTNEQE